jgi:exopolyphosphatase/guanosine-5'-triphosphate,3'-diphosphate pyrophosphatase
VKREAGFEVELISGEEEARRTMLGIRSGLPYGVTDMLALDIGGCSTEFIIDLPGENPVVRSIDIGVVRLCERFLHHDPPTDEEVRQAREWVARETKAAVADMENYQIALSSAQREPSPAWQPWPRNFLPTNRPESTTTDYSSATFKNSNRRY